MATDIATSVRADGARKRKRAVRLSTGDRVAMAVMVGIPVIVTGALIWFPTICVDRALVHELGRDRRPADDPLDRDDELPPDRDHLSAVLAGVQAQPLLARRARVRRYAVRDAPRLPARQADPRLADLPELPLHPGRDRARDHRPDHRAGPVAAAGPRQQPLRGSAARARDRLARRIRASASGPCSPSPAGGTRAT